MDAEKLNEAAREARRETAIQARSDWHHSLDGVSLDSVSIDELVESAFEKGAQWLMQQPLADRLTEEEKEKIKAKYNELKSLNSITDEMFADDTAILEWLFDKELFNEK